MIRCRDCRAPMIWVITTHGKLMPLDPEPNPKGNIRYTGQQATTKGGALADEVEYIDQSTEMRLDEDRYTTHFATCPHPERFRKK